jgi:replicative DNA helicase
MNQKELPQAIEMEKQLLSAMFMKEGQVVPEVAAIIDADDLYRVEHRLVFQAVLRLYAKGEPIDYLAVEEELRKSGDFGKIDHLYLLHLIDATFTTARAQYHANIIKEKANLRKIIELGNIIIDEAERGEKSPAEISFFAQQYFNNITRAAAPSKKVSFSDFFANHFDSVIEQMKAYSERTSGFDNLDQFQFFHPGLYVIGATPAAGKTTFCWQLLEQLARNGETCIYCSYEMSQLELFSKSLAREIFKRVPKTELTAADIRRGAWSLQLAATRDDFAKSKLDLSILELQDESVDDLLSLLKPLCFDKAKAPVVCLDYLQIVPTSREFAKLGVDDSVRKLKKFQRDTNTTFIVISSFNRTNYTQSVSFESFKESGNIEYTADVVWALQLNILNSLNPSNIGDSRKKIDEAKKQQPRQIQLKCLKNRQGTNYECFFQYFSAHDCFVPCDKEAFKGKYSPDDEDID